MALGMTASTAKVRPFVAPVRRGRTSDSGAGGDQVERPFISSAMLAVMMVIASAMGVWMLAFGITMVRSPGNSKAARRLLLASIVYLPIVLLVLVLDRV